MGRTVVNGVSAAVRDVSALRGASKFDVAAEEAPPACVRESAGRRAPPQQVVETAGERPSSSPPQDVAIFDRHASSDVPG
jgi:hypothetical protein